MVVKASMRNTIDLRTALLLPSKMNGRLNGGKEADSIRPSIDGKQPIA